MPYDFLARLAVKVFGTIVFPVLNASRESQRKSRSRSWDMVFGKIRSVRVTPKWEVYLVSVNYVYSVNGQNYPGFLELRFAWKKSANAIVAMFPSDLAVMVLYNPAKMEDSVLLLNQQPMLGPHF